jgi:hypothetical protein
MAAPICDTNVNPNLKCCYDSRGNHTGCWDETQCEACIDGRVIRDNAKESRILACLDCDTNTTICNDENPNCCFGKCFKINKDCKTCDQVKKDIVGCPDGYLCCQNNSLTGIGCWNPNSSANKCKKCDSSSGQLVDKCSDLPNTPYCCPDTGNCINQDCSNCDGTPKCTGNTWCCNCSPTKTCCNNCEDCSGSITLSYDDQQNCLECQKGEKVSKCLADQECCQGTCIAKDGCKSCSPAFGVQDTCKYNSNSKTTCCGKTCWDPYTDRCGKCENQVFTPNKCGTDFICCSKNGNCIPGNDLCQNCDGPIKLPEGQICCTDDSDGSKRFVLESNCCNGKILRRAQGQECCNGVPYDPEESICCGNQTYNKNVYGCCNNENPYLLDGTQKCCNQTVITVDDYTDCCEYSSNGETISVKYDKLCKVCTLRGPLDNYDSGCEKCLRFGGKFPICKDIGDSFDCCSIWQNAGDTPGQCYDTKRGCDTCNQKTGKVTKECPEETPDCCGKNNCWNQKISKCSVCADGKIVPKCPRVAGVGQDAFGEKFLIRLRDGKDNCCSETGECYGKCDSCAGSTPELDCKNNTDGKTSCCNYSGTCYNSDCYYCDRPAPKLRDGCKSCCDGKCCPTGNCCEKFDVSTAQTKFKCCAEGEYCCLGDCVPNNYIECETMCVPPSSCCNGKLVSFGEICCNQKIYSAANCTCCNNECINPIEKRCCVNTKSEEFSCDIGRTCCGDTSCVSGEPCCNNKVCCAECCEGPHGGCINTKDCEKCDAGIVTPSKSADEECCAGVPFTPKNCEKCTSGVKIPYVPSAPNCYCYTSPSLVLKGIPAKEVCGCPLAGLRIEIDTENTGHCCDAATFKVRMVSSISNQGSIIGSINLNNSDSCNVARDQITVSNDTARDLLNNLVGQDCCNFKLELICDPTRFGLFQPFGPFQCHTSIANGRVFKKLSDGSEVRVWSGYLDNSETFNICDETLLT